MIKESAAGKKRCSSCRSRTMPILPLMKIKIRIINQKYNNFNPS